MKALYLLFAAVFLLGCQSTGISMSTKKVPVSPTPIVDAKATSVTPIVRVHPKYPKKAARAKQNGWVKLSFDINDIGKTESVKVVDVSPQGFGFEKAAIKAVEKWYYHPRNKQQGAIVLLEFQIK